MTNNINMMSGIIADDTLIFSAISMNGLFKYNIIDRALEFFDFWDKYEVRYLSQHIGTLKYNDYLFFVQQGLGAIDVYNLKSCEQKTIPLLNDVSEKHVGGFEIYNDKLYILPFKYGQEGFIINLHDFSVSVNSRLSEFFKRNSDAILFTRCIREKNQIFAGIRATNKYIEYNLDSEEIILHETDIQNILFLQKGRNGIWVIGIEGDIEYLGNDGMRQVYNTRCAYLKKGQWAYNRLIEINEDAVLLPAYASSLQILKKGKHSEIAYPPNFITAINTSCPKFYNGIICNESIFILPSFNNNMLIYKDNSLECIPMKFKAKDVCASPRYIEYIRKLRSSTDGIYVESNDNCDLRDFLITI